MSRLHLVQSKGSVSKYNEQIYLYSAFRANVYNQEKEQTHILGCGCHFTKELPC